MCRLSMSIQTAAANDIALTLKQVRVSPTAAYATVCVDAPGDPSRYWLSSGTLRTGAGMAERIESTSTSSSTAGADCHTVRFFGAHYSERGGEWTLALTKLTTADQRWQTTRQVGGKWNFHFTVPQP
jgi:hypothetical protein